MFCNNIIPGMGIESYSFRARNWQVINNKQCIKNFLLRDNARPFMAKKCQYYFFDVQNKDFRNFK
jgi:hypothetical protein